jgi:nitrate reductase NapAB chaperone NapD
MSEYHICGVLLLSRPEHGPVVERALKAMAGTELHCCRYILL